MRIDWSDVGTLDNEPADVRHNEPALTRANATGDETMNAGVKRLRDALSSLVVTDGHAADCPTRGPIKEGVRVECTCGYIERLSIARKALAETDDSDAPEVLAVEAAALQCEADAKDWLAIAERAKEKGSAHEVSARERAHAASQCARRIRRVIVKVPSHPNRLGREGDITARWRTLLYAESRLQAQRDEIVEAIEHACDGMGAGEPGDGKTAQETIIAAVEKVLDDQVNRPSPDFRALLLNTRKQLEILKPRLDELPHNIEQDEIIGAMKEAMRLTDVERLDAWPPWTVAGIALRHVVDHLADELSDIDSMQHVDDAWLTETLHDLRDARDKPNDYLTRKQAEARTPRPTDDVHPDAPILVSATDLGDGTTLLEERVKP